MIEVLNEIRSKIAKFRDRGLGEQNTKASMIEPVLEALGWDVLDPDEVHREFKANSKDCPVDYALKLFRKPQLFVEAKGLGENLSDRKWIAQVLGYATVAGVEWCVLTDGNHYRFFNATAAVDAEEKLFREVRISEAKAHVGTATVVDVTHRQYKEYLGRGEYRWELWNVEHLATDDIAPATITKYAHIPDDSLEASAFRVDLRQCRTSSPQSQRMS